MPVMGPKAAAGSLVSVFFVPVRISVSYHILCG